MSFLWNPTKKFIRSTNIYLFQKFIESKLNKSFLKYNNLWKWSVKDKENFWDFLSIYFKVRILKLNHVGDMETFKWLWKLL